MNGPKDGNNSLLEKSAIPKNNSGRIGKTDRAGIINTIRLFYPVEPRAEEIFEKPDAPARGRS